nr:PTS system glucose-specific transporter subunits IIBC [Salmonella sp. NCTC 7297]
MFKNAFANLQKVGKSLMLPVSVLPIAGILLGVGSANFSWLPAVVSHVMAEAGGSVFANMPLIFAIGVALGFTNNDGVSALAAVVAYGIMVKTMAVVAPLVLHLPAEEIAAKHLADTGVLGGIISGAIAAYMFNRFYRIKLPEYLGFFAGKRFVPIISGLAAIFTGVVLSFVWPPIGTAIQAFSQWAAYQNPVVAFGIYGFIERCLVPFGLHHIWNVPFQMQIGEYNQRSGPGIPRRHSSLYGGRSDGGYALRRFPVQNVWPAGCGHCHLALCLNRKTARKWAYHDLRRADLVFDWYYRAYRVLLHVRGADPVHYSRDSGRSGIPDLYSAGDA